MYEEGTFVITPSYASKDHTLIYPEEEHYCPNCNALLKEPSWYFEIPRLCFECDTWIAWPEGNILPERPKISCMLQLEPDYKVGPDGEITYDVVGDYFKPGPGESEFLDDFNVDPNDAPWYQDINDRAK